MDLCFGSSGLLFEHVNSLSVPHTRTHTSHTCIHTHTSRHTHTHIHTLHTHAHTHTHIHPLTHSHPPSHTHTSTLSHTHITLSSPSHTHTSPSHTHTSPSHTHTSPSHTLTSLSRSWRVSAYDAGRHGPGQGEEVQALQPNLPPGRGPPGHLLELPRQEGGPGKE